MLLVRKASSSMRTWAVASRPPLTPADAAAAGGHRGLAAFLGEALLNELLVRLKPDSRREGAHRRPATGDTGLGFHIIFNLSPSGVLKARACRPHDVDHPPVILLQRWQLRPPPDERSTPQPTASAPARSAACTLATWPETPRMQRTRRRSFLQQSAPSALPQRWQMPTARSPSGGRSASRGARSSGSCAALCTTCALLMVLLSTAGFPFAQSGKVCKLFEQLPGLITNFMTYLQRRSSCAAPRAVGEHLAER